jgi:hypothetical protein
MPPDRAPTALRSKRTSTFKKLFDRLPAEIQRRANELFAVFEKDPQDPLLCTKALHDSSSGRHRSGSFSTHITIRYRAIYVIDNGKSGNEERQVCWYWVGSREDYANFVNAR